MVRRLSTPAVHWLHRAFEASLVLKALLAATEAAAGIALRLTSNQQIRATVDWLADAELIHHPHDPLALLAERSAAAFSFQSQHFYAIYLLSHGGLKLAMVAGLALRIRWSYPVSMLILAGFVLYQFQHWTVTHSPVLLALSAFDLLMIGLVWREYRSLPAA